MNWNRIRLMLMICIGALAVSWACSPGIPFLSQAEPTATSRATRVARATFTAKPPPTEIVEPTDEPTETAAPEEPTETPVPVTDEPTAKPQVQNTAKPRPTNPPPPPAQPTNPPPPPPSSHPYVFVPASCPGGADPAACNVQNSVHCEHSAGTHIIILVFGNRNDPGSTLSGIRVVASYAADSPAFGDTVLTTDPEGKADYVQSPDGSLWTGNAFAWIVDKNNTRISDIGGPVVLNDHNQDSPDPCQHAVFAFVKNN